MKNKIMTHVVAGYPSESKCIDLLMAMQKAGVSAIEIQIPFSDPSADGPTIMKANDVALENGTTTAKSFFLLARAREKGLTTPVYIMSYANKLYRFGFEKFCNEAKKCQVSGFIIPDLPFDSPEYRKLSKFSIKYSMEVVPVLSPGIMAERLSSYDLESKQLVYLTSMKGITGKDLVVKNDLIKLIRKIRSVSSCQIALGFGIRNPKHVQTALSIADMAVIGSEVIRRIDSDGVLGAKKYINQLVDSRD